MTHSYAGTWLIHTSGVEGDTPSDIECASLMSARLWLVEEIVSFLFFFPSKKKRILSEGDTPSDIECASLMSACLWLVEEIVSFLSFSPHKKKIPQRWNWIERVCVTHECPSMASQRNCKFPIFFSPPQKELSTRATHPQILRVCVTLECPSMGSRRNYKFLIVLFPPRNFCCLKDFVLLCYRSPRGRHAERWGAGVEYHFQEFNEPYAPS